VHRDTIADTRFRIRRRIDAERQLPPDAPGRSRAEDKSERTVKSYTEAVRFFADYQRLSAVQRAGAQLTRERQAAGSWRGSGLLPRRQDDPAADPTRGLRRREVVCAAAGRS
jgi:hypothetical protein